MYYMYFKELMKNLDEQAIIETTDPKVFVGCALGVFDDKFNFTELARGFNCNYSFNERLLGKTYRQIMFGSTDTKYRPWDKIIHAEENAVFNALSKCKKGHSLGYNTAVVTRYPCEKCAQLLIAKGIKWVIYGRSTPISEETAMLFRQAGVQVIHIDYEVDEEKEAERLKSLKDKHLEFLFNNYKIS